jgi:hypothetical protein
MGELLGTASISGNDYILIGLPGLVPLSFIKEMGGSLLQPPSKQ